MKRYLLILFTLVFALSSFAKDFTFTYEGQTLTYTIINQEAKTCSVSAFNRISGDLTIPSKVSDGTSEYTVIAIGERAFYLSYGLDLVRIPNSVTSIGERAFDNCQGLTSVQIPNSVISIGDYAFYRCYSLATVQIPNSITSIGEYAFLECRYIIEITSFGDTPVEPRNNSTLNALDSIGKYAFMGCSKLKYVQVPNSVKSIGESSFYGCSALTSVVIGSSVEIIKNNSFTNCSKLAEITCLGSNPPKGEKNAFDDEQYNEAVVKVPDGKADSYKSTSPWSYFAKPLEVSGIAEISVDFDANLPYLIYNLGGVYVGGDIESLPAGIYIVRQGSVAKKISVGLH